MTGIRGEIEGAQPLVSVVLVNWNTAELTENAILSFQRHERSVSLEFIIVDNASTGGDAARLERAFPEARVIRSPKNEGFARGNNRGVEAARGEHVLLLNTDTISREETLPACLEALKANEPAIAACRLLNADGSLQLSAEAFPSLPALVLEAALPAGFTRRRKLNALPPPGSEPARVDWLCGAYLLLKREAYRSLGGLSPDIFMYGEDVEFCWRAARAGVRSVYVPGVSLIHLGGGGTTHGTLRGLIISDAGRLRSFALMRGKLPALALRVVFILRSLARGLLWGATGLAKGSPQTRKKARQHLTECLVLGGALNARRFI